MNIQTLNWYRLLQFIFILFFTLPALAEELIMVCEEKAHRIFHEVLNDIPTTMKNVLQDRITLDLSTESSSFFSSNNKDWHNLVHFQPTNKFQWRLLLNKNTLCANNELKIEDFALKKAFVHSIGHIFEEINLISTFISNKQEKLDKIINTCNDEYHWESSASQISPTCQLLWSASKGITQFKNFPVINNDFLFSKLKSENFPEILETYVYDKLFSCAAPAIFNYLYEYLGKPAHTQKCPDDLTFYLQSNGFNQQKLSINPAKVWKIHYLLIEDGTEASSKFGHSAFRIILCSPHRKTVGPDCINDIDDHIVFSFLADTTTETGKINILKGFFGGYSTRLEVQKYKIFIENYTVFENRNLKSYPLKFDQYEVQQFLSTAYEITHINQHNEYKFITNNCATSSYELIQKSLKSPLSLFHLSGSGIVTPKNLLNSLHKHDLISLEMSEEITDKSITYLNHSLPISLRQKIEKIKKSDLNKIINFESIETLQTSQEIYSWTLNAFSTLASSKDRFYWERTLASIVYLVETHRADFIKMIMRKHLKEIYLQKNENVFEQKAFEYWMIEFKLNNPNHPLYQEFKKNEENLNFFRYIMLKKY